MKTLRPSQGLDGARALAVLGAAGAFFAFANPVARLPLAVLLFPWCLARVAQAAGTSKRAFRLGWLSGTLASSASLYWIALPVHDYGFLPWILAVPCPMAMGCVLGLYTGLFCWALARTSRSFGPVLWGLFAGLSWWGLEALKGWLFTGFPWFPLAEALTPWPWAIQSVNLIGAYGLSAVLAMCAAWLAPAGQGSKVRPALAALVAFALLAAYGLGTIDRMPAPSGSFSAALIQGNVDQGVKWSPDMQEETIGKYAALSRSALSRKPDILLWPETAMPFYLQEPSPLSAQVRDFARQTGIPLVTGAPGFERRKGREFSIFNSAFLVNPDGSISQYDKQHLVPFGEYAPFGQDIPILETLLQGVGAFTPGTRTAPLRYGRVAMGVLICYEAIFPELAQKRVEDGANVLVNLSNDAWFGRSAAPVQQLELAALRAVEQGRSLVRATNTGISAVIDSKGRIQAPTGLFLEAAPVAETILLYDDTTLFHRAHGWLEGLASLAALGLLAWTLLAKNRNPKV